MIDLNSVVSYLKANWKQVVGAMVAGYVASHYPMFSGPAASVGKCLGF